MESIHESSVDIVIVSLQPSTRYALFRIFARILDTLGKLAFVVGTPPPRFSQRQDHGTEAEIRRRGLSRRGRCDVDHLANTDTRANAVSLAASMWTPEHSERSETSRSQSGNARR